MVSAYKHPKDVFLWSDGRWYYRYEVEAVPPDNIPDGYEVISYNFSSWDDAIMYSSIVRK